MVLAREISVEESAMAGYACGGGAGAGAEGEWSQVHAQMVAYVAALSGSAGERGAAGGGVWREHSYARATRRAPARHAPRTLLAPDTDSDSQDADAPLDVGSEASAPSCRPALPCDTPDDDDEAGGDAGAGDDEWEARVAALAPSAAHARLAARAADILRDLRLARLAVAGAGRALRREQARAAASKLRRALAPTWLWSSGGGGGGGGGAAWLYSVLSAYLPVCLRALLEEVLDELRRAAPRLAARLPAPRRAPPHDPLTPPDTAIPATLSLVGPLVVWVSAGRKVADERWWRRLAALLPTRVVPAAGGGGAPSRAPPDVWCAQQAAAARQALNEALAEAGSRPVFLAGFEAGAALCCALASGLCGGGGGGAAGGVEEGGGARAVRGVALLAPPLVSAEGEEALDARAPLLLVAGGSAGGAGGGRVGALEACAGGRGARRLVVVGGADDALRLPARLRQRLRVPQQALDAAIVEEVARWVRELADDDADADDDNSHAPEAAGEVIDVEEDNEYAHLPSPWTPAPSAPAPSAPAPHAAPAAPAPLLVTTNTPAPQPILGTPPAPPATPAPPAPGSGNRAIEIIEGRVVSRVSGSTPLMLTPRRAPPPSTAAPRAPHAPHAPADIMQMPIVFADDDLAALPSAPHAVTTGGAGGDKTSPSEKPLTVTTVTSGAGRGGTALKYTRVIVAKRGAGAGGGGARAAAPPRAPPGPAPGAPARGGSRPVLLRRAVRVVGRVKSRTSKEYQ